MREGTATLVRRVDYAPPAHWIRSVDLSFELDPAKTLVINRMQIERNSAQPAHDDRGLLVPCEFHQQGIERHDVDGPANISNFAPNRGQPLFHRKHRRFGRVRRDTDDQPINQLRAPPDNVHMPERDRIKCARINTDPRHYLSLSMV